MAMTATQKIKQHLLLQMVIAGDITLSGADSESLSDPSKVDEIYDGLKSDDHSGLFSDYENEFRTGQQETDIEPTHPFERGLTYYEKKSVAAQMPDGSWVGWIYWFGGGKHSEPEAIDWMSDAYDLTVEEKPVQIIQRTFTKVVTPCN